MKIVTAAEMRQIDRITSERYGIPSLTLMENAGSAVAQFVLSEFPGAEIIGVICGKGNNGGDGFVAARKLHEAGKRVRVLLLADPADVKGDAAEMLKKMPIKPLIVRDQEELASESVREIYECDVRVDAILGTGFKPPVTGLFAAAIGQFWKINRETVAIDIPSGADSDVIGWRELRIGGTVPASRIVTFTSPKLAHVFSPLLSGQVIVVPIGSPKESITSQLDLEIPTPADMACLVLPRQADAHKGSFGHVLIIGGSVGKAGAAAMAGIAALRAGAGLVTVACPKSVLPVVAGFTPELMTEPLEETDAGTISLRARDYGRVESLLEGKDVVALGPGLSRNPESAEFTRWLVQTCKLPIVLDADGLNAFAGYVGQLDGRERPLIVTPHPGEMARLAEATTDEINEKAFEITRRFASEHNLTVVLKGHRTLSAEPTGRIWVNTTGNPGMATGGTGDVLTGMIAALIAQRENMALAVGLNEHEIEDPELRAALKNRVSRARDARPQDLPPLESRFIEKIQALIEPRQREHESRRISQPVFTAVYLHGLSGDLARVELGEHSLIATDLIQYLPKAFARTRAAIGNEWMRFNAWNACYY